MRLGHPRTALGALLALAAALWLLPAGPAFAVDPFTVAGVPVDTTADNAANARAKALDEGQRNAFTLVMQRMTLASDWPRLPKVDEPTLLGLVQGFEVADEHTTPTRYIAKLTVTFKREALRSVLRGSGVPFTESVSRATLVLPIFDPGSGPAPWQDANPWRDGWAKVNARDALAPLLLPVGDAGDAAIIGTAEALAGDLGKLDALARHYAAGTVLVALAKADAAALQVTLVRYGLDQPQTVVESYPGQVGPDLYAATAAAIANRFEEDWKRQTLIRFDAKASLDATISFAGPGDWLQLRRRLEHTPEVQALDLVALTRRQAQVVLHYYGDPQQLASVLGQADIELQQQDGAWNLRLKPAGAPAAAAAAPAPTAPAPAK
ncbi:MAG TPA: DUF2066 domain-containing protein [Candidatus Sulfotelmatobacter sp.]|nr:DUF2066 domain-containing protein [Candidatus Sulfotelmatobacter sp.]